MQRKGGVPADAEALLAGDFAAGQLPAGLRGATGPQGPVGQRAPAGQDGFGLLVYPGNVEFVANGESVRVTARCGRVGGLPEGVVETTATGGDALAFDESTEPVTDVTNQVLISQGFNLNTPPDEGVGWFANVTNNTGGEVVVVVEVACANADNVIRPAIRKDRRRR